MFVARLVMTSTMAAREMTVLVFVALYLAAIADDEMFVVIRGVERLLDFAALSFGVPRQLTFNVLASFGLVGFPFSCLDLVAVALLREVDHVVGNHKAPSECRNSAAQTRITAGNRVVLVNEITDLFAPSRVMQLLPLRK